jgi:hypothetical protein
MSRAWQVKRLDPDAPLALNARRVLAVRVGEFYSWEPIVDDNDHTDDLHQLRISAKRLRYTLELFRSVFGEAGERNIERVRDVQELLGTFHDQEVRIELIEDGLRRVAAEQATALASALAAAEPDSLPDIVDSALQMPLDDPKRGMAHLLGRQHAARLATLRDFRSLWINLKAAHMREDLVALSCLQISMPESTWT